MDLGLFFLGQGEIDFKGSSFTMLTVHIDETVMLFDYPVNYGHAEPRPFTHFLGGEERLENACPGRLNHPVSGVTYGKHGIMPPSTETIGSNVIISHFKQTGF